MNGRVVRSLRLRLAFLVLLAVLPVIPILAYGVVEQRNAATTRTRGDVQQMVTLAASDHAQLIEGARQLLTGLSALPQITQGDPRELEGLLSNELRRFPQYDNLSLIASTGMVIASAVPTSGPLYLGERPHFRQAIATRQFAVGEYQISKQTGTSVVALAMPVLAADGQVESVVTAALGLGRMAQFAANVRLPEGSSLIMLDRNGTVLERVPGHNSWVGKSVSGTPLAQAMMHGLNGSSELEDLDGERRLYAYTALSYSGQPASYLAVGVPTSAIQQDADRGLGLTIGILSIVVLGAMSGASLFGELFVLKGLRTLVRGTAELTAGNLDSRVPSLPGELGDLAEAFNAMARSLQIRDREATNAREELQRERDFISNVMETSPVGIVAMDAGGSITLANERAESILGLTRDKIAGLAYDAPSWRITDLEGSPLPSDDLPFPTVIRTGVPVVDYRHAIEWPDGRRVLLSVNGAPVADSVGRPAGVVATIEDVTESIRAEEMRKNAERSLEEALGLFRALVNSSPSPIMSLDPEKRVRSWNPASERVFGWSEAEVVGKLVPTVPPDQWGSFEDLFGRAIGGEAVNGYQTRRQRKDGTQFDTVISIAPVRNGGRVVGTISVVMDISDRLRAEEELRESRERLRTLSQQLLDTQEAERRHLARELHDEIGQYGTSLKITLEMCRAMPPEKARSTLGEAIAIVDELLVQVRGLSLQLRPPVLDDLGLLPALLWSFQRYSATTHVEVDFKHAGIEAERFDTRIETTAFRLVQEALTNVARHAGVSSVVVRVFAGNGSLNVEVEDQGVGFDVEAAVSKRASGGLFGMRERVSLLGGALDIQSAPQAGTTVSAEIPLR